MMLPDAGGITPERLTTVYFDQPETVLVEPAQAVVRGRNGPEIIHIATGGIGNSERVVRLATGYIGLEPIAAEPSQLHELTGGQASIIASGDWALAVDVANFPIFKRPDNATMPDVLTGSAVDLQASGDTFYTLRRPAGATWATGLLTAPLPPAPRTVDLHAPNILMDVVAEGIVTYPEDQGYLLRFITSGTQLSAPDRICAFEFGGPLTARGHGRFALLFAGDGMVALSEFVDEDWVKVDEWQFAGKKDVANKAHSIRILPHARRFIEFESHVQDYAPNLLGQNWHGPTLTPPKAAVQAHVYEVPKAAMVEKEGDDGQFTQGLFVTGYGAPRFWVRRDLRPYWQISRLLYPTALNAGQIICLPTQFPFGSGENVDVNVRWEGPRGLDASDAVNVTWQLIDQQTDLALPNPFGYLRTLPGNENIVYTRIRLTASAHGVWSPWIDSYQIRKSEVTATATPGAFSGRVDQISIEGPTNQPDMESASITLIDEKNEFPRLRNRSRMTVEVKVEMDGGPEQVSLFRGYVARPNAQPRGRTGEWAPGKTLAYTERVDYQIQCSGAWTRLAEALSPGQPILLLDSDETRTVSGRYTEPKVTDLIRNLLSAAGFAANQIDVPDVDMRFFQGKETLIPTTISPFSPLWKWIQDLAEKYLGAFLIWDQNAGTVPGMWRLKLGPLAGTPLFYFLTETPASPSPALVHTPGLWGDNATFIRKDTYVSYPIRMEANAVWVSTMGDLITPAGSRTSFSAWAWNKDSFNLPWSGVATATDPDHPDYIGSMMLRPHYDPDLDSQAAVDFVCRRLFEITCRTRKAVEFVAPFHPVEDPDDAELAGRRRPLRYGDTVGVGPTVAEAVPYFVISCNPAYRKDWLAESAYELQEILT